MSEQGPFDRILESSAARDKTARTLLIGMGALGILLLVLVFSPIKVLGGADGGPKTNAPSTLASSSSAVTKLPKVPAGYEALSALIKPSASKDLGPVDMTVSLAQPVSDGRNLGLYTYKNGEWQRLAGATLVNNGAAAKGQVASVPANVAVLRRVSSAVQVSGWLVSGAQVDPAALDALTTLNPVDYYPSADGTVLGAATPLNASGKTVIPTIRATAQREAEAVNAILASPQLRDAHVNALMQIASAPGNGGIDIDYPAVAAARKPDFTAFVASLADRLHAANKQLTLTLPAPVKTGINWDTGAYDWKEIARYADNVKLASEVDPSLFYKRMEDVVGFLKPQVDLKKVQLVVPRSSKEKASNGVRLLSLRDGLALATNLEVRTSTAITPTSSVLIVAKNIYQDDGASGVRWDDNAFAVSFSFPGSGGQHTVWLENAFSIAFRLDFARRMGLGGVHVDDVALDASQTSFWEPLATYASDGAVKLSQPNGVLLRPVWQSQAGQMEPNPKGNVVWKAPAQAGVYDVSLVISDGVVRATQKVVLDVKASQPATAVPSGTGTPRAGTTATPVR
jgi:hypothetical protein